MANLDKCLNSMLNIVSSLQDSLKDLQSSQNEETAMKNVKEKTKDFKKVIEALQQDKELEGNAMLKQAIKAVDFLQSSLNRM